MKDPHKNHKRIAISKVIKASYLIYEIRVMLDDGCPELDNYSIDVGVKQYKEALDYLRRELKK